MKTSHIAAVIVAASLGCTFGALAIAPSQDAEDPTVRSHADQTHQKTDVAPSSNASDRMTQSESDHNKATKHPPAAIMDRATPQEKSTEETGTAAKHPPSRVMDRAVPDQKTPGSSDAQKPQ